MEPDKETKSTISPEDTEEKKNCAMEASAKECAGEGEEAADANIGAEADVAEEDEEEEKECSEKEKGNCSKS